MKFDETKRALRKRDFVATPQLHVPIFVDMRRLPRRGGGEAAAKEGSEGLKRMANRKGEPRYGPTKLKGAHHDPSSIRKVYQGAAYR